MEPAEEPPAMVPPAVGPAPQSAGTSTYPVLCCSPQRLDLIPSDVVGSAPATLCGRPILVPVAASMATSVAVSVAVAVPLDALPVVEAPVSVPVSPSLLDP